MQVSFEGYGEQVATFACGEGLQVGVPVKVSANGTVAAAAANDAFFGVAVSVRGGYAAVQMAGYVRLPYSGETAPALGYQRIAAAAGGKVASNEAGHAMLVVDVQDGKVGLIL